MIITKSDFIRFLHCPESFWLLKHKPEMYPHGEISNYERKIAAEGDEVEKYAEIHLCSGEDADAYSYQTVFRSQRGLYARADIVRTNQDGSINIYEVKSSTKVKTGGKHDQLRDVTFQRIVAEDQGYRVSKTFIVHLNGDYVRSGVINPEELLRFADVTHQVSEFLGETREQVENALALVAQTEISEQGCSCRYVSKANRCDAFAYFNQNIPTPSIYDLPRISSKKIKEFVDTERLSLSQVSDNEVTAKQLPVLTAAKTGTPYFDHDEIARFYSAAQYPLYFLDYEAYSSAIPVVDGARPQAPIPFQYSLHIKRTPDKTDIEHVEYLSDKAVMPRKMAEHMRRHIGDTGSIISWHASYENTQNNAMAELYPDMADFLLGLVKRTLDLEQIFFAGYVDIAFQGSTSIKKVLPVLAPDLSYDGMKVTNGADAMEAWARLIAMRDSPERQSLRTAMLKYCELDTWAMVRIFDFLNPGEG